MVISATMMLHWMERLGGRTHGMIPCTVVVRESALPDGSAKTGGGGIEAELGLGYAYLASEFYYNIPNGAWYDFATKHYWGPTRVNVGISYMLSRKVTKSTGNTLNK